MPESVKISELPPLSSVQPNDIIPVVDELLTQTSKATAAQIAAIGGGPPGVNTVSTDKIQDGAVTAQKIGFSGPNKLISRTASGPGQGLEIPCSPFARGLLAIENAALARDYLDALQSTDNPTFTGQVKVGRGTSASPAIAPAADPETGIFFPESGAISFSSDGVESFRFAPDGTLLTKSPDEPTILRGRHGAVAWVNFNAAASAGAVTNLVAAQHTIAARYGLTLPGAPSAILGVGGSSMQSEAAATRAYMKTVETARGYTLSFPDEAETTPDASWFTDAYGKVNYAISPAQNKWPAFAKGTSTRANFTSPGDDRLWYWNGSAWVTTTASGKGWIGTMTLTANNQGSSIREARGVAAVSRTVQGTTIFFTVTFEQPMVDTSYCTLITASGTDTFVPPVIRITGQSTTAVSFAFQVANSVSAYYDPTTVCVAVFR